MMTAIAILVAFLAGATAGIAVLLRVGMVSEDSRKPLVYEPATRAALATRCVVGLYVLPPRRVSPADRGRAPTPDNGNSRQRLHPADEAASRQPATAAPAERGADPGQNPDPGAIPHALADRGHRAGP
jgi:hypothetical protein